MRNICEHCREQYDPDPDLLRKVGLKLGVRLYRGKGCRFCRDTGYRGRSGVYELLVPDRKVQNFVIQRASSDEIKDYCIHNARFETLRRDGLRKALDGITTLEQVVGVTQHD